MSTHCCRFSPSWKEGKKKNYHTTHRTTCNVCIPPGPPAVACCFHGCAPALATTCRVLRPDERDQQLVPHSFCFCFSSKYLFSFVYYCSFFVAVFSFKRKCRDTRVTLISSADDVEMRHQQQWVAGYGRFDSENRRREKCGTHCRLLIERTSTSQAVL